MPPNVAETVRDVQKMNMNRRVRRIGCGSGLERSGLVRVVAGDSLCVGVAAATGKMLWQIPFKTVYAQNIVTPALYHDTLIFSGIGNPVMGVKVLKRGAEWTTETVWENKDFSMYMSSPVVSGDLLFGFTDRKRGQFFCLKAGDGATLWSSQGRQADNAAVVAAGSVWLILTPDGNLTVARQNDKAFEPLRKYSVADSATWAHPVVMGHGILIKDVNHLALWDPS